MQRRRTDTGNFSTKGFAGEDPTTAYLALGTIVRGLEQATPFEHRSFGDELARCQRYFQVLVDSESVYFGGGYLMHNVHGK